MDGMSTLNLHDMLQAIKSGNCAIHVCFVQITVYISLAAYLGWQLVTSAHYFGVENGTTLLNLSRYEYAKPRRYLSRRVGDGCRFTRAAYRRDKIASQSKHTRYCRRSHQRQLRDSYAAQLLWIAHETRHGVYRKDKGASMSQYRRGRPKTGRLSKRDMTKRFTQVPNLFHPDLQRRQECWYSLVIKTTQTPFSIDFPFSFVRCHL